VGNTETGLAEPIKVFQISNPAWRQTGFKFQISRIIEENEVKMIVVGVPGEKMEGEIRQFGRQLEKVTGLSVEYVDETLTTHDAQRELIASGRKQKDRREKEDAIAAAIMLEYYMKGGDRHV